MTFNHGLEIGQRLSTYKLQEIFKHNRYRGMRYSLTTNTLVIISDHFSSPYNDRWENGILYYTGMGLRGNQKIDFMQNKTLAESNTNGVEVFLCEIFDDTPNKYIFAGRFILIDDPYKEKQFDEDGVLRDVWIFPLKPVDINENNYILPKDLIENANFSKGKQRMIQRLSNHEIELRAKNINGKPGYRVVKNKIFERNAFVSEFTKRRANGLCELCESPAPFKNKDGNPYLETHHIIWLSKGGIDTLDNTVALCPNCHRKMHSLNLEEDINKLKNKVKKYRIGQ